MVMLLLIIESVPISPSSRFPWTLMVGDLGMDSSLFIKPHDSSLLKKKVTP
jgi:hypothetical protein